MNRRTFLQQTTLAAGGLLAGVSCHTTNGISPIRWSRASRSLIFTGVACDGEPLVRPPAAGLLDAECRLWREEPQAAVALNATRPVVNHGALRLELSHRLRSSGGAFGEDLLEGTLTVENLSADSLQVEVALTTTAQPPAQTETQELYLPLSAAGLSGDPRFTALGVKDFLKDCRVVAGPETFRCHYLEPLASHPDEPTTRAMLLAPVVNLEHSGQPWRVALFTASDQPVRFGTSLPPTGREWRASRVVNVPPRGTFSHRVWLLVHRGDASVAWRSYHRFAHHEAHPPIAWVRDFKVHYYDFLSSAQGQDGARGDGYDADTEHFREFRVGLATQHGYYPCMGDHLHPDRRTWLAMQGDKRGPVAMSFDKLRARIRATRAAGAKAAIYMHMSALDDSSREFYPGLANGRRVDAAGQPVKFGWNGPDVKGGLWWMSMSSAEWRAHLLQQAAWIMEVLQPDAICMDETFSGLGYNYAGGRPEPLSAHAIEFFKALHALVRSFGREKALFSSDCSMGPFCLWADGEVGDHAYRSLLGHPLYAQSPVRYLAALGDKPWRPCAWHWQGMWKDQMRLARQVGAGVGVSNGWGEFSGLTRVSDTAKARYLDDIASLS